MTATTRSLCVCLLNVSEGRKNTVVETIARAALSTPTGSSKSAVLNIFSDYDYNRSVITIAAAASDIANAVLHACCTANKLIDLSKHDGGHPRLGAVDLVPIHPVSADITLDDCGIIARDIASKLTKQVPGSAAFLFGAADMPKQRGLVQRRKELNWYSGKKGFNYNFTQQDVGAMPSGRYGLTGIGAIPYVMNCNVTINTKDVVFGREIAKMIRATSSTGLPGVQSMAFAHEGHVEIACNVEGIYCDEPQWTNEGVPLICSFGKYYHVSASTIEAKIRDIAIKNNVSTIGTAIVGFSPKEAEQVSHHAISQGKTEYWKERENLRMM